MWLLSKMFFPSKFITLGLFYYMRVNVPLEKFRWKWTLWKSRIILNYILSSIYFIEEEGESKEWRKQIFKNPYPSVNHHFSRFSPWKNLCVPLSKIMDFQNDTLCFFLKTNSAFVQICDLRLWSRVNSFGSVALCPVTNMGEVKSMDMW